VHIEMSNGRIDPYFEIPVSLNKRPEKHRKVAIFERRPLCESGLEVCIPSGYEFGCGNLVDERFIVGPIIYSKQPFDLSQIRTQRVDSDGEPLQTKVWTGGQIMSGERDQSASPSRRGPTEAAETPTVSAGI